MTTFSRDISAFIKDFVSSNSLKGGESSHANQNVMFSVLIGEEIYPDVEQVSSLQCNVASLKLSLVCCTINTRDPLYRLLESDTRALDSLGTANFGLKLQPWTSTCWAG